MGESIADEIRLRKRANTDWSAYDDWWNQAIEISADIAAAREADLRAEVERLTQANREAVMQAISDGCQAQEALERAVAAEAERDKVRDLYRSTLLELQRADADNARPRRPRQDRRSA